MNGEVGFILEQSHFEFLGEQSLRQSFAFLSQRSGLELVTGRFDNFKLEREFRERFAALVQDHVGLGQRQSAAPCRDGDGVRVHACLDSRSYAGLTSEQLRALYPCPNSAAAFSAMISSQWATSSLRCFKD